MTATLRKIFPLLLFIPVMAQAQYNGKYKNKKHSKHTFAPTANSFLLSGQSSVSSFASSPGQIGLGLTGEYYFATNWSVRGGIIGSGDYSKVTLAPLTAEMLKWFEQSDQPLHSKHLFNVAGCIALSLAMNDGVGYNFPVGKYVHIMPYFGSWQIETRYMNTPGEGYSKQVFNNCSLGMSIKIQPTEHVIIDVGGEYIRPIFFSGSSVGYRMNLSIGYKFNQK